MNITPKLIDSILRDELQNHNITTAELSLATAVKDAVTTECRLSDSVTAVKEIVEETGNLAPMETAISTAFATGITVGIRVAQRLTEASQRAGEVEVKNVPTR